MGMRSLDPSNLFFKDWIHLALRGWICLQINSQAAFLDWQDWAIFLDFLYRYRYCKFPKLKQNTMSSENTKLIIHRFEKKAFIAILMGVPFLQILVHFSQLKQELRDAKGIWTWSRNHGNLIFKENLSIVSN